MREKWWYIYNLKFSKISNLFNDNMDSNKLQYNPNIWLNINFNKLKLNQNKLKLNQNKLKIFLIQLLQLKRNINKYYSNILVNINSYILQYNQGNSSMYEKHNFNDLCQLKKQINQLKINTIKHIDNILDNKSQEYNNITYKIYSINTINPNNINNNNIIEENGNNNEIIDEENLNHTEFMQKVINDPYFVESVEVTGKQFNTVKLVNPNTKLPLERPVHIKNIIKFNSTTIP